MRLVVELKRGANPQIVLNQLYKNTQLQDSFGVIILALVDSVPRTLNLAELIGYYIDHQVDVVTRRTQLRAAQGGGARPHRRGPADRAARTSTRSSRSSAARPDADEARTKLMTQFKLSRDPGEPHPRHAAPPAHAAGAREARGGAQGAAGDDQAPEGAAEGPEEDPRPDQGRSCSRSRRSTPTSAGRRSRPTRARSTSRT